LIFDIFCGMPISTYKIRLMRYSTGQNEFRPMRLDFAGTRAFRDKLLPDGTQLVGLSALCQALSV
jgi:hypothetical protein